MKAQGAEDPSRALTEEAVPNGPSAKPEPAPQPAGRWARCATWPRERWELNLRDAMLVIKIWTDANRMREKLQRELHR